VLLFFPSQTSFSRKKKERRRKKRRKLNSRSPRNGKTGDVALALSRDATADQIGGKRESEVKVTSGYRRRAENVWCLSSLMLRARLLNLGICL